MKSFRSIFNLSFLSKVADRLVVDRFNKHADLYHLLPPRQSAYRQHHSTETAITIVYNDIVCAIDAGEVSVLVLFDLSAAFDTVDHDVLLDVLQKRFRAECCALDWFSQTVNRLVTCQTGHNHFALHQGNQLLSVCPAVFRKAAELVCRSLSCTCRISPKQ